jgi:porin
VSANPSDRNLIDLYADGGFTYKGLIPGREDDTFGVGVGYARISRDARALDFDAVAFAGVPMPVRSSEALIEVTYQAQVIPGWTVQPDFQYVFRPGGNVANPRDPNGEPIRNAAIFGLRTTVRY